MKWIKKPCIKPVKKYDYKLCDNAIIKIKGDEINIPPGFVCDLASIPRFLWSLLSPRYAGFVYPAILHDYIYRTPTSPYSRKEADDFFYEALRKEGVSWYTANKMWLAVRNFGIMNYKKRKL